MKLQQLRAFQEVMLTDSVTKAAHNMSLTQPAVSALISLGFKPQEASRAVSAVQEDDLSSEDLIRRALKGMV